MNKKTHSVVILTLLLIGMLTLAFDIQPVKAEPRTWTVDDDGPADFSSIQEAVSSLDVEDGDTIYVYNGLYYEHIHIYKSLTVVGENKYATIIDGSGYGPVVTICGWRTNFTSFTVRNAGWTNWESDNGIRLYRTRLSQVTDCIVSGCAYGIREIRVRGVGGENVIMGNMVSDATEIAIGSSHHSSIGNVVANNIITNSSNGIYFNIPLHNTVNGNTIRDMIGEHTAGIVFQVGGSNNTVTNNTVIGYTNYGIAIQYADKNHIAGNTLIDNFYGIELGESSCNNTVTGNNASGNGVGISVFQNSKNNLIVMNDFSNSVPVEPYLSDIGVWFDFSDNNILRNNNLANNRYGVRLYFSSDNRIYHNSLTNNTFQVNSYNSMNVWDDGYPSGGNYWSDYEERYPDATEIDDSGIWDTPYVIGEDNQDNYPLMEPWSPLPRTIGELQTEIEELGCEGEIDNQGIVKSFLAKLNVAQKLVDKGKIAEAKSILEEDFIPQVQNLTDIHITPEVADILIQSAEYIISHL